MPREAMIVVGLSNRVYRLATDRGVYYLRLPQVAGPARIDRAAELHNLALAAEAGVARAPVYGDPVSGVLATRAVAPVNGLDAALNGPGPANALGHCLGRLHASGADFRGRHDPVEVIAAQRAALTESHACPDELKGLFPVIAAVVDAWQRRLAPGGGLLVPSHVDPSPGNCLLSPERMWLIDWEYSALADPAWDLAYAVLEHGLCGAREQELLTAYRAAGGAPLATAPQRLAGMKALCDAVSCLWAFEQMAAGRGEDLFLPFARDRAARLRRHAEVLRADVS